MATLTFKKKKKVVKNVSVDYARDYTVHMNHSLTF